MSSVKSKHSQDRSIESKHEESTKSNASKNKSIESKDEQSIKSRNIIADVTEEFLRRDFNTEEGIKQLIVNHIRLNKNVGLFNIDLSALARFSQLIDKALLDMENRLRKLEGRTELTYKSFLEDILSAANLGKDAKLVSNKLLALNAELEALKKGGRELSSERERLLQNFLDELGESGFLRDKLGQLLELQSITSSQLEEKLRYQEKGIYSEGRSSMEATSVGTKGDVDRTGFGSDVLQRWELDYAESIEGRNIKRIPGVSYDTYERSLHPFECRKCGEMILKSEQLTAALFEVEVNYFLIEGNSYDRDISLFTCRVCGLPVTSEDFIRKHVNSHVENNQVYFCLKCQIEINRLEDSCDVDEDSPDLIPLRMILTLDDKSFTRTRADITFAPRCAKCDRVFSYLFPLVKKIFVRSSKAKPFNTDQVDDVEKCFYVCLVCGLKKSYKSHIELHALGHIENNELYCTNCSITEAAEV